VDELDLSDLVEKNRRAQHELRLAQLVLEQRTRAAADAAEKLERARRRRDLAFA
jgi:hypothetical protein